jgi:hypothetical protein
MKSDADTERDGAVVGTLGANCESDPDPKGSITDWDASGASVWAALEDVRVTGRFGDEGAAFPLLFLFGILKQQAKEAVCSNAKFLYRV